MKKFLLASLILTAFFLTGIAQAVNLDDFNGPNLDKMWTYRDPANKGKYSFSKGMMVLELKAGADMYIKGTDGGVCFLMEPPALDNFSVEMLVNVAVNGTQPAACHVGPIFFNEDSWAYTVWGPYANTDIRMEDCVGGSYRWRADTQIGVDVAKVAIDKDVYVKITKTGSKLEFFTKGDENDNWVSGGVDAKLGPNYIQGKYKVGICAKSWGGSVDSVFNIDYFTIPEIAKAVDRVGKLATTWSSIKN